MLPVQSAMPVLKIVDFTEDWVVRKVSNPNAKSVYSSEFSH